MSETRTRLDEIMRNYQSSIVLLTAGKAGIFAALGQGARTAENLSETLDLDVRATDRLLLALTADGFLVQEKGTFRLAEEYAPFLLPDSPLTQASILNHNFTCMRRWAGLLEVLQTGQPVPRDSARFTETQLRDFICGMANLSRTSSVEVAEKFDFSPFHRLLDLGGGPGTAAIVFAQLFTDLHCVVFDLPEPLTIATEEIAAADLTDRVTTLAGDFLEDDIGRDYDLVYVANIIHSLGEADTALLMRKVQAALRPGGTAIIKDFFLDDDRTHPPFGALFSINMLVGTDAGKSYTWTEMARILEDSGFGDFEAIPVAKHSTLFVARRLD